MEGAHVVSEFDNSFHVNNVLVLSNCYHGGNVDIHIWWDYFKMDFPHELCHLF